MEWDAIFLPYLLRRNKKEDPLWGLLLADPEGVIDDRDDRDDPCGLYARDDPASRLGYDGDRVTSHSAIRVRLPQSKLLRK
jgi:hypothetical protein